MHGNNQIVLCRAELNKAVQYYFDKQLFKEGMSPEVTSIDRNPEHSIHGESFVVKVSEREVESDEK